MVDSTPADEQKLPYYGRFGTMGAPKAFLIALSASLPTLIFMTFLPDVVAWICGVAVTVPVALVATGLIRTEPGIDEIGRRMARYRVVRWALRRFHVGYDVGIAAVVAGIAIVFLLTAAPLGWALGITACLAGFVVVYAAFRPVRTATTALLKALLVLWAVGTAVAIVYALASGDMTLLELLDT